MLRRFSVEFALFSMALDAAERFGMVVSLGY